MEAMLLATRKEMEAAQKKLEAAAKKMDHLERAKREAETPLLEAAHQQRLVEDKLYADKEQEVGKGSS